jgi:hypothetical protein
MTILQAPALSLLPATATAERLPSVVSPLVIATVLPTALWPLVRRALDELGGSAVYLAGGILVVGATLLLRSVFTAPPSRRADLGPRSDPRPTPVGVGLAVVFAIGIASAVVTRLASDVVPKLLAARVEGALATPELLSAATLGVATLLSPSLGSVGRALGSGRGAIASVAVAIASACAAPLATSFLGATAVAFAIGAALALHLDCALPFALGSLPVARAGLSSGVYLGGVFAGTQLATASSLLDLLR